MYLFILFFYPQNNKAKKNYFREKIILEIVEKKS